MVWQVLIFGIAKTPNFIDLRPLYGEPVANSILAGDDRWR